MGNAPALDESNDTLTNRPLACSALSPWITLPLCHSFWNTLTSPEGIRPCERLPITHSHSLSMTPDSGSGSSG